MSFLLGPCLVLGGELLNFRGVCVNIYTPARITWENPHFSIGNTSSHGCGPFPCSFSAGGSICICMCGICVSISVYAPLLYLEYTLKVLIENLDVHKPRKVRDGKR